MAQMQPYPTPLGFFKQFHAQAPGVTLEVKEKSWSLSGDSFDITMVQPDGQRVPIFRVQGEAMSLSGRKHVYDMQGNHLFDLRKEHIALHTTYYAEDGAGNKFLHVVSKFSIGSSKAIGKFTNASGKEERLLMKGDFFSRSANITDEATGIPVASIARQFGGNNLGRELLAGKQTYLVSIAPNVDMALVVAMCIALDEKKEKK
ncbi:tubby C-terminal-like domain-containing protein [Microdochium bolleyi]|uniref:Tubby C-terminal-like domain-containing protein n=1 Tax=Microdochium bolleyi TaxID=196109 RepID=A0A136IX85_9PEZI|nr:tubby C-terminal-like domain-containing protein [Microdochium bolleyi]